MSQSVSNHPSAHSFVIYDLETTGLDPLGDDLIQIAAVRFCAVFYLCYPSDPCHP